MENEKGIVKIAGDDILIQQEGKKIYVKTADMCALLGKSNQWIGQLAKDGVLVKVKFGSSVYFDLEQSLKSYLAKYESKTEDAKKLNLAKDAADVKYKKAKADMVELKVKEIKGKMHSSEDVKAMTEDLIFSLRSGLVALPARVATEVASALGTKKVSEISEIIKGEVFKIMAEMSEYVYDSEKYKARVMEREKMEGVSIESEEE